MALNISGRDKLWGGLAYTGVFVSLVPLLLIVFIVLDNIGKIRLSTFLKYHLYQSILLNIIFYFVPGFISTLFRFLAGLCDITYIFAKTSPILIKLASQIPTWFSYVIFFVALYGIIWTFRGKYTHIPLVSQAVNMFLR